MRAFGGRRRRPRRQRPRQHQRQRLQLQHWRLHAEVVQEGKLIATEGREVVDRGQDLRAAHPPWQRDAEGLPQPG